MDSDIINQKKVKLSDNKIAKNIEFIKMRIIIVSFRPSTLFFIILVS